MTTTKWTLDKAHSDLQFKVKHMMISNVSGSFTDFDVQAETENDDFSTAIIDVNVDLFSIDTNNDQRDAHLRTADFLEIEKFPKITFRSLKMEKVEDNDFRLIGDLSIRGVTKAVSLNVEFSGIATDPYGQVKAGFSFNGKINRLDFGVNWNVALEAGGILVSEEVRIIGEIQLIKNS